MEGEIQDKVSCPVCLEIPDREIYHCKNGHTVCFTCSQDIRICPQCRAVFENPKMRNRVLEDLLDVLKFDCPHKHMGCMLKLSRKEIPTHRNNCLYGGELIKFCETLRLTCEFSISPKALFKALTHFQKKHEFVVRRETNFDIRLEGFENYIPTENKMWTPVVIDLVTQEKKLFVILCTINGTDSTLSVMCLEFNGSDMEASSTNYRVSFCVEPLNKQEGLEISWISKPIQRKHFALATKTPTFRIPLNVLQMHYVKDNTLIVKCCIEKNTNTETHLGVQNAEQISIVPMFNNLKFNEASDSTNAMELSAKNTTLEASSSNQPHLPLTIQFPVVHPFSQQIAGQEQQGQGRKRRILKIVDPKTGKNVLDATSLGASSDNNFNQSSESGSTKHANTNDSALSYC